MAKRKISGEVKSLEDRLGKFAFMRRAREQSRKEEEAKKRAFDDTEEWTGGCVSVSGCTVVMEGGSGTTAPLGRMSFQSFNPKLEKIQKDLESESVVLQRIRECGAEFRREMGSGAEISDLEMAKRLGAFGVVTPPAQSSTFQKTQHNPGQQNKRGGSLEHSGRPAKMMKMGDGASMESHGGTALGSGLLDASKRKQSRQKFGRKRKHQKERK